MMLRIMWGKRYPRKIEPPVRALACDADGCRGFDRGKCPALRCTEGTEIMLALEIVGLHGAWRHDPVV